MNKIHPTAEVNQSAKIGDETSIWNQAQIRENAIIGKGCIIGKNVYIDFEVKIGNNVKIQNNSSIFHAAVIEDGVFIGPHVILTNNKIPRAINPDGSIRSANDWKLDSVKVCTGASIGAGSTILPGVVVGRFSMIGAGSVVTKNVPDHALVYGNPAMNHGYVCKCGDRINPGDKCGKCQYELKN